MKTDQYIRMQQTQDERGTLAEIDRQEKLLAREASLALLYDMPPLVFVLNASRQIIWHNKHALEALGGVSAVGKRPGEAFGCVHAAETGSGCGGANICGFCGGPKAFYNAVDDKVNYEEWVIQRDERHKFDSLDLLVWSKSISIGNERFALLSAQDESPSKHREMMERIFYHDIGNTINGMRSLITLMEIKDDDPHGEYMGLIEAATDQLIDEIQSHKSMREAELGELSPLVSLVAVEKLVDETINLFAYSLFGKGITILKEDSPANLTLWTDPVLLRRIVVNMLKNAMEASGKGDTVRIGFAPRQDGIRLWVWNSVTLSEESRVRMFQRSYSTKGRGRGYGTYSMKLLCQRYLGGSISFSSAPGEGTRFTINIPNQAPLNTKELS